MTFCALPLKLVLFCFVFPSLRFSGFNEAQLGDLFLHWQKHIFAPYLIFLYGMLHFKSHQNLNGVCFWERYNCKSPTQRTVSTIPQTVCPRTSLKLDQETSLLAGCQRVVYQLVRGWTLACPKHCALDSLKASPQGINRLFTRYYLFNIGCLPDICVSCLRMDISLDR